MSQNEFNDCPICGVGKMRPMGGGASIGTSRRRDPQLNKVTDNNNNTYAEYKCDNCGNPGDVKGRAKPVNRNNADV